MAGGKAAAVRCPVFWPLAAAAMVVVARSESQDQRDAWGWAAGEAVVPSLPAIDETAEFAFASIAVASVRESVHQLSPAQPISEALHAVRLDEQPAEKAAELLSSPGLGIGTALDMWLIEPDGQEVRCPEYMPNRHTRTVRNHRGVGAPVLISGQRTGTGALRLAQGGRTKRRGTGKDQAAAAPLGFSCRRVVEFGATSGGMLAKAPGDVGQAAIARAVWISGRYKLRHNRHHHVGTCWRCRM
eukprot:SAG31_NODE_2591_length_5425_cov_4.004694_2_plen_243_part_00